jgi:hypothetical protein
MPRFFAMSWLKMAPQRRDLSQQNPSRGKERRPNRFRPWIEALEDRTVPSAVLTVTSAADDGSAGTLRAVIASAASGDTIVFSNQLPNHTITLTSQITITKNLDIEGPGANKLTVSGNNASRVFDIANSATVTIAGLTIANGSATSTTDTSQQGGGGVLNEVGATVHLNNDVFSNNTALVVGGALWNQAGPTGSGTATVSGSTFIGNEAIGSVNGTTNPFMVFEGFGPGNGTAEGGAIDTDGSLNVADSTFKNNEVVGVPGSDNTNAGAHGGAIGADGSLIVTNSTFTGNRALGATVPSNFLTSQGLGGGVVVFGSGMITGSTFTGNEAVGGAGGVSPSKFAFVGAGGGLLALSGASLTVSGCTFNFNEAIGGAGGAGGGGSIGIGGGLAVHGPAASLILSDSFFSHNAAIGGAGGSGAAGGDGFGGGLSVDRFSTATITDIAVAFNQAAGGDGGAGANGGNGWGGGIAVGGRTVYVAGASDNSSVTLSGSTISNNVAVGGNGGLGGNGGNGSGGGVFVGATIGTNTPSLDVSGSSITNNHAMGGAGTGGGAFGLGVGGGVYNLGSFTFDVFTDITGNHASTSNDDIFP